MGRKFGKVILVAWFAFLASCGSITVVVETGGLGRSLGLPKTFHLVMDHIPVLVGTGIVLFLGLLGWFLADTLRAGSILPGGAFWEEFLYVTMLAVGAGALVASVVIPVFALAWVLSRVMPEPWALALSAPAVLAAFAAYGFQRRAARDQRPERGRGGGAPLAARGAATESEAGEVGAAGSTGKPRLFRTGRKRRRR